MNTREKIITEALNLFSQRGFTAVSVREISGAVGIKESSLYNHFKNKQDIFDKVVDWCWEDAKEYFQQNQLPFDIEDDISLLQNKSFDDLLKSILRIFGFFFENETTVRFRKLLVLSQYENERARDIYHQLFVDYMLKFQSSLFQRLMEAGELKEGDPADTAMEFYGPVFLLIHTCDSLAQAEPYLVRHLKQFLNAYGKEG